MLKTTYEILGSTVVSSDIITGGVIEDLYFDKTWAITYFVVRNESTGTRTLVSPITLSKSTWLVEQHLKAEKPKIQTSPQIAVTPAATQNSGWGSPGEQDMRSVRDVLRYYMYAAGDPKRAIEDFIIETDTWTVLYMVTGDNIWQDGRKNWIEPCWPDPQDYDSWLYDYYGRPAEQLLLPKANRKESHNAC